MENPPTSVIFSLSTGFQATDTIYNAQERLQRRRAGADRCKVPYPRVGGVSFGAGGRLVVWESHGMGVNYQHTWSAQDTPHPSFDEFKNTQVELESLRPSTRTTSPSKPFLPTIGNAEDEWYFDNEEEALFGSLTPPTLGGSFQESHSFQSEPQALRAGSPPTFGRSSLPRKRLLREKQLGDGHYVYVHTIGRPVNAELASVYVPGPRSTRIRQDSCQEFAKLIREICHGNATNEVARRRVDLQYVWTVLERSLQYDVEYLKPSLAFFEAFLESSIAFYEGLGDMQVCAQLLCLGVDMGVKVAPNRITWVSNMVCSLDYI